MKRDDWVLKWLIVIRKEEGWVSEGLPCRLEANDFYRRNRHRKRKNRHFISQVNVTATSISFYFPSRRRVALQQFSLATFTQNNHSIFYFVFIETIFGPSGRGWFLDIMYLCVRVTEFQNNWFFEQKKVNLDLRNLKFAFVGDNYKKYFKELLFYKIHINRVVRTRYVVINCAMCGTYRTVTLMFRVCCA